MPVQKKKISIEVPMISQGMVIGGKQQELQHALQPRNS